jgi:hypothetical protein
MLLAAVCARAEDLPLIIAPPSATALVHGDASLFRPGNGAVEVWWDSSRTNSYFYYPLGLTLTAQDRFSLRFSLRLSEIAIGTTPEKPYTFQIAVGLINTTNAFDPQMYRGTGVNTTHGARNLVEWNYFPDSGFGATVAPTIASEGNQIAFSGNYPLELKPDQTYSFELTFSPEDRTLRSTLQAGGSAPLPLKNLILSSSFDGFQLNALAISSYSDFGQSAPFAGSIQARGVVSDLQATVFDRPRLTMNGLALQFRGRPGWQYFIESSSDLTDWQTSHGPFDGTGGLVSANLEAVGRGRSFRVRGVPL